MASPDGGKEDTAVEGKVQMSTNDDIIPIKSSLLTQFTSQTRTED